MKFMDENEMKLNYTLLAVTLAYERCCNVFLEFPDCYCSLLVFFYGAQVVWRYSM